MQLCHEVQKTMLSWDFLRLSHCTNNNDSVYTFFCFFFVTTELLRIYAIFEAYNKVGYFYNIYFILSTGL